MKINPQNLQCNLFLKNYGSDTSRLVHDVVCFAERHPVVLERIRDDQVAHGLAKKKCRLEDAEFNRRQRARSEVFLPGMRDTCLGENDDARQDDDLVLLQGRDRVNPLVVLILLTLRGFYGSITDRAATDRILESSTLQIVLGNLGHSLPRRSSISENLNCVSQETLDLILRLQLQDARNLGLDDFKEITVDSTTSGAAMAFPTDISLVATSICSLWNVLELLGKAEVIEFAPGACAERWLLTVRTTARAISTTPLKSGTLYRRRVGNLAHAASMLEGKLEPYVNALVDCVKNGEYGEMLAPARRAFVRLADMADRHHTAACHSIGQMVMRVLRKRKLKPYEKYLGPADPDARLIVKGDRKPVVGYHPQLARSRGGLVTCVLVDPDVLSDSKSLIPVLEASIANTGVVPRDLSTDDGYSAGDNLAGARKRGVENVSFSGANGKRLFDDEEWNSLIMRELRVSRSAVESLIFTLKHNHDFDRMKRTGRQAVRAEMTEKVLAYNFRRIRTLREREAERAGNPEAPEGLAGKAA